MATGPCGTHPSTPGLIARWFFSVHLYKHNKMLVSSLPRKSPLLLPVRYGYCVGGVHSLCALW